MPRKQRLDTTKGALDTMSAATAVIDPPPHVYLSESALPFWRSITSARSADRWNSTDLECAAQLARAKADIERITQDIIDEGDIIINDRGTPIVNPKQTLLETITRRQIALTKMLQVHAEATQGKSRDQVKKNKAVSQAREALENSDDGLIPRASH